MFHVTYASPISRGRAEVIEDIVPVYNVPVTIRLDRAPVSLRLVPDLDPLPFTYEGGYLKFVIPCVNCHQAVKIQMD